MPRRESQSAGVDIPSQIAEHEVSKHLHDRLFYGMYKGLRDSIRYFYDNLTMTFTQLMVAVRKAESEASEVKDTKLLIVKSTVSFEAAEESTE